jgi:hypothetical protein
MALAARRLRTAPVLTALAMLWALAGAGCHFALYPIDPNDPLAGQRLFAIEPVSYSNLMVGDKPEPMYLGEKKPEQQQSWQTDKAEAARQLTQHLLAGATAHGVQIVPQPPADPANPAATAAAAPFIVRTDIQFIEPGNFNGFVNFATEVRMLVTIINPQGQPFGQTIMTSRIPASIYNPSSGGRLREAGEHLGDRLAQYVVARSGVPW